MQWARVGRVPAPVCRAAVSAGRMLLPQNLAVGMWRAWLFVQEALST